MVLKLNLAELFRKTKALKIYKEELSQSQFFIRSKIKRIQWIRLKNLLNHAYRHVPYYNLIFNEYGLEPSNIHDLNDLKKLPTLTKDIIRNNYSNLIADNARLYHPRIISSGGSTGDPLRFYIDTLTNSYQWADVYRGQIIGGWRPGDKMARIWGTSVLSIQNPFKKKFYSWLNDWDLFPAFQAEYTNMHRWLEDIRRKKIRFISGYVDTIVDLARIAINENMRTQLVGVFPTTAPLTVQGRRIIEKAFGCGIFDLYQSADGGLSSIECHQHKGLHISEESCLVELPEKPGEHQIQAVVTDLFNYAMPFIRYENGDELIITDSPCPCGRELPLITRVRGKTYHHIILPNGNRVHSEIFSYYLNNFLITRRFYARQTSPTDIILEISLDDNYMYEMSQLERAINKLPDSLPGMNIEVEYIDRIKKLPNQKYINFEPYNSNN